MLKAITFQANLTSNYVFQSHTNCYEIFQNVNPALLDHKAKKSNLDLKLSLISNKNPKLHSSICFEMNNASVTN